MKLKKTLLMLVGGVLATGSIQASAKPLEDYLADDYHQAYYKYVYKTLQEDNSYNEEKIVDWSSAYWQTYDFGKDNIPELVVFNPVVNKTIDQVTDYSIDIYKVTNKGMELLSGQEFYVGGFGLGRQWAEASIITDQRDNTTYVMNTVNTLVPNLNSQEHTIYTVEGTRINEIKTIRYEDKSTPDVQKKSIYYIDEKVVSENVYVNELSNYSSEAITFESLSRYINDEPIYSASLAGQETTFFMVAKKCVSYLSTLNNYTGENFYEFLNKELNKESLVFGDAKLTTKYYLHMGGLKYLVEAMSPNNFLTENSGKCFELVELMEKAYKDIVVDRKKVDISILEKKLDELSSSLGMINFNDKHQKKSVVDMLKAIAVLNNVSVY